MARETPFATLLFSDCRLHSSNRNKFRLLSFARQFNFQAKRNINTVFNMIRKTYGVSGLMDWTTQIKAGKAAVSVHFSGGALTAYGVTPAKYSTTNPIFQSVIEKSEYFQNGRIKLLDTMEVPDDASAKARKERMAARMAEKPTSDVLSSAQNAAAPSSPAPVNTASPKEDAEDESNDENADGLKVVEVADKKDAIEYLKENYPDKGYGAVKLRTKEAFEAACKEHGIKFVFTA